jgi:hypothetical protein
MSRAAAGKFWWSALCTLMCMLLISACKPAEIACTQENADAAFTNLVVMLDEFHAITEEAENVGPIELPMMIADMQAAQAELDSMPVPDCASEAKLALHDLFQVGIDRYQLWQQSQTIDPDGAQKAQEARARYDAAMAELVQHTK